jgi:hypothetical protein
VGSILKALGIAKEYLKTIESGSGPILTKGWCISREHDLFGDPIRSPRHKSKSNDAIQTCLYSRGHYSLVQRARVQAEYSGTTDRSLLALFINAISSYSDNLIPPVLPPEAALALTPRPRPEGPLTLTLRSRNYLNVEFKKNHLESKPLECLKQLAYELHSRPNSKLNISELDANGHTLPGLDGGGLTQNFLTILASNVKGKILDSDGEINVLPEDLDEQAKMVEAYENLGTLFAWCSQNDNVTGEIFDDNVFNALQAHAVQCSSSLDQAPPPDGLHAAKIVENLFEAVNCNNIAATTLGKLLNGDSSVDDAELNEAAKAVTIMLNEPWVGDNGAIKVTDATKEALKTALIEHCKITAEPVLALYRGMNQSLATEAIQTITPNIMKKSTQGSFNRDAIANKIKSSSLPGQHDYSSALKRWIKAPETTDAQVKQFLYLATSSRMTPRHDILIWESAETTAGAMNFHTCPCFNGPNGIRKAHKIDVNKSFFSQGGLSNYLQGSSRRTVNRDAQFHENMNGETSTSGLNFGFNGA